MLAEAPESQGWGTVPGVAQTGCLLHSAKLTNLEGTDSTQSPAAAVLSLSALGAPDNLKQKKDWTAHKGPETTRAEQYDTEQYRPFDQSHPVNWPTVAHFFYTIRTPLSHIVMTYSARGITTYPCGVVARRGCHWPNFAVFLLDCSVSYYSSPGQYDATHG